MSIDNKYKDLLSVTNEEKEKISNNTTKVLPLEPSAQGYNPQVIRQKQWYGICGETGSVLALLKSKLAIINTYIEEELERFSELQKEVDSNSGMFEGIELKLSDFKNELENQEKKLQEEIENNKSSIEESVEKVNNIEEEITNVAFFGEEDYDVSDNAIEDSQNDEPNGTVEYVSLELFENWRDSLLEEIETLKEKIENLENGGE